MKEKNHAKQALKNILISGTCFIIFLLGCSAPKNIIVPYDEPISVDVYEDDLQKKLNQGYDSYSLVHVFPFKIVDIAINYPEKKALLVLGREKYNPNTSHCVLVYCDLEKQKVFWTKQSYKWEYKSSMNDHLWGYYAYLNYKPIFLDNEILFYAKNKLFSIDKKTGNRVWDRSVVGGCIIDTSSMVALTGELIAFDLNTGQNIWERDIKNKFGVTDIYIDSAHILLAANGIHRFSLKNGFGWSHKFSTGRTNEVGTVFANIGLALLSGGDGSSSSYIEPDIWSGMCSNILLINDTIYFTARNDFYCIDLISGNIIWQKQFPQRQVGYVDLFEDGNNILAINNGYNLKNGIFEEKYGEPFISKYNKLNGNEIFYQPIPTEHYISDFEIDSNKIVILTYDELFCYNHSGKLQHSYKMGETKYKDQFGKFYTIFDTAYSFASSYIPINASYEPLSNQFTENIIINTGNGYLEFSEDLNISRFWPDSILMAPYSYSREYIFCQKRDAEYDKIKDKEWDIKWDIRWALMQNNTRKYLIKQEELYQFRNEHPQLYEYYTFDKDHNYLGKLQLEDKIRG